MGLEFWASSNWGVWSAADTALCACVVVQTQAICNYRITARAVIWSMSYFLYVSIFLLTALGSLPENPGSDIACWNKNNSECFFSVFLKKRNKILFL